MAEVHFRDGIRVGQSINHAGASFNPGVSRSDLAQESLVEFPIPLTSLRVWNAMNTLLPGSPAADDLGLVGGAFGTNSPVLETIDEKANAAAHAMYARCLVQMPAEFDAGADAVLRLHAKMVTTVADTTAELDVEIYKADEEGGIGADLVSTAATSFNSLTGADYDFVFDASALSPGDILDVRIKTNIEDGATGTEVKGRIGAVKLACDIRG